MKKLVSSFLFCAFFVFVYAQTERDFETSPTILNKISDWQDLKFGLMIHWGAYSQWGIVESWSICNESWCDRNGANYVDYVKKYNELPKTFNPVNFNPEEWAEIATQAGMKYLVFTTKHHDGFCMYDTKLTDYSITGKECPFSSNPQADITKHIVNAFKSRNCWIGLYFSKPDWHCPNYWAPEWATPDRNVNYNPKEYPERFQKYVDFTYQQLDELVSNYGKIDILWLDGGWIRPEWSLDEETRPWLGCQGWIQDINMPTLAQQLRKKQNDMLIVDRSVHGQFENYRTPEQQVPDSLLPYPWETCMSMGNSWSYVPDDTYKSGAKLIHLLVDIVAKGGNFLLNIGPAPDGTLPDTAINRLKDMESWMNINKYAIYDSRPIYPYACDDIRYTQNKHSGEIYAFYLISEKTQEIPSKIYLPHYNGKIPNKIKVLGYHRKQNVTKSQNGYYINIEKDLRAKFKNRYAIVFCLSLL